MRAKHGKYYTTQQIDKTGAKYRIIVSERSDGKTYAVKLKSLETYHKTGKQLAYIRRWDEDITGRRASTLYDDIVSNGEIERITNGKYNNVVYKSRMWYLAFVADNGQRTVDEKPFCYGFSISAMTHDKSTSYPNVTTICFDEFIDRRGYLPDEFTLFSNVLSTIIRDRDDVTIYMLGNTVNKFCPYFAEMGLKNIKKQQQGTIDLYHYGDSGLTVAVEYSAGRGKEGKPSDVYFAFNNPKLKMITTGAWEINVYPRSPHKIKPKNILFSYYINYDFEWVQCDIVSIEGDYYTHIHPCSEPKDKSDKVIFSPEFSANPRHYRILTQARTPLQRKILEFYQRDKIFYSDNDTGELIRNYLIWCGRDIE